LQSIITVILFLSLFTFYILINKYIYIFDNNIACNLNSTTQNFYLQYIKNTFYKVCTQLVMNKVYIVFHIQTQHATNHISRMGLYRPLACGWFYNPQVQIWAVEFLCCTNRNLLQHARLHATLIQICTLHKCSKTLACCPYCES